MIYDHGRSFSVQVLSSTSVRPKEGYDRLAIWCFLTQDPIGLAGGVSLRSTVLLRGD